MCDNSNRTNINNTYDDNPSYSSQNVGYSGRPQDHTPLSNQNLQQTSNDYDSTNSSELVATDRNDPPSQMTQPQQYSSTTGTASDNRTNGSAPDLPAGSKRLHVSNIPFRFRENDLHGVFAVSI